MSTSKISIATIKNPLLRRLFILLTLPVLAASIVIIVAAVSLGSLLAAICGEALDAVVLAIEAVQEVRSAIRKIW